MEELTFHLSGVLSDNGDFTGPLNTILTLLSKNKVEIKDIRISDILDQYLAYLDEMSSMDMEIATEFVAMAAHLVYIKSRMLLDTPDKIEELSELISSLETLKAKNTMASLALIQNELFEMYRRGAGYIGKPREILGGLSVYRYCHSSEELINAMLAVLTAEKADGGAVIKPSVPIPERTIYPVEEKSDDILNRLYEYGSMRLTDLFAACTTRSEVVAALLSILELCKNGSILIVGDNDEVALNER